MKTKRKAAVSLAAQGRADIERRLKNARGHLDGVLGMIEDDASCIDLLTQVSAIRSALNRVSHLIVQHHLDRCFMELVRSGDEKTAIAELMRTLAYDSHGEA
jgi:DNA-binding FrmR family transcriptional regulator